MTGVGLNWLAVQICETEEFRVQNVPISVFSDIGTSIYFEYAYVAQYNRIWSYKRNKFSPTVRHATLASTIRNTILEPSHKAPQVRHNSPHYIDVIMSAIVLNYQARDYLLDRFFRRRSKETSKFPVTLISVRGSNRWPVNSSHTGPVTRKMFPFDDVIMGKCEIQDLFYKLKARMYHILIFCCSGVYHTV